MKMTLLIDNNNMQLFNNITYLVMLPYIVHFHSVIPRFLKTINNFDGILIVNNSKPRATDLFDKFVT